MAPLIMQIWARYGFDEIEEFFLWMLSCQALNNLCQHKWKHYFRRRPTVKGVGLRVVDSYTGNHPEDDFTPLETIQRLCSVFGRRSHLGFEGETFELKGRARNLLNEKLRKMIEERHENQDLGEGLLGILLGLKGENQLSDLQIADNIIGVIFAAHDTTASALTWLLKYLHDHPHILDAVKIVHVLLYQVMNLNADGNKKHSSVGDLRLNVGLHEMILDTCQ
ncbi:abscisic acid 8'-hydroxylase 2-like protein [Tanacetum coccineum]